jgi:hypothetical protein
MATFSKLTPKHTQPSKLNKLPHNNSLAKIDKKAIRHWRWGHPKRYHPPSTATCVTARSTTRSVAPSLASRFSESPNFNHNIAGPLTQRRNPSRNATPKHTSVPLELTLMNGGNPIHTLKQKKHN